MSRTRSVVRKRRAHILLPMIGLAVTAYFAWHAAHGAHGFLAREELQREEVRLSAELAGLRSHRRRLEQQVELLRPDSVDPDFLEQRAIELLNFADINDHILTDEAR
jgi:cell division protein FtsB